MAEAASKKTPTSLPTKKVPAKAKKAPVKRKPAIWVYMYGSSPTFDETVDEWTLSNKEFPTRAAALEDAQTNQDARVVRILKSYGTYKCEQTTKLVRK